MYGAMDRYMVVWIGVWCYGYVYGAMDRCMVLWIGVWWYG